MKLLDDISEWLLGPTPKPKTITDEITDLVEKVKDSKREINSDIRKAERERDKIIDQLTEEKENENEEGITEYALLYARKKNEITKLKKTRERIEKTLQMIGDIKIQIKMGVQFSNLSIILTKINTIWNSKNFTRIMEQVEKGSQSLELIGELIDEKLDEIGNEQEDEKEAAQIVDRVLTELNLGIQSKLPSIPNKVLDLNNQDSKIIEQKLEKFVHDKK